VHRLAAVGASGSFFDFQSAFAVNKLPIAYLAPVTLLAVFGFSELVNCICAALRALFIGRHDKVLDLKSG
jgi:hypothetical protein